MYNRWSKVICFRERAQLSKTIFRKAALASCMILTIWSGILPVAMTHAWAQGSISEPTFTAEQFFQNPNELIQNTSEMPKKTVDLLQQGVNPGSINNVINQITGIPTNTINSLTDMVKNIANGSNMNPGNVTNILSQVLKGEMPGELGKLLSQVKDLGNIFKPETLTKLLGSESLTKLLGGLNLGDLGKQLDNVLNSVLKLGDIKNLLNPANIKSITDTIAKAFPGLEKLLGATGLKDAITKALTDIAGGKLTSALSSAISGATGGGGSCSPQGCGGSPCQQCHTDIPKHYATVRTEITAEISKHQTWFLTTYWKEHILPALMLMAEQLSVAGIAQVNMFGAMLDAKHQLETQRIFQTLQAEAHKDYQPSEGMCTFGTTVRSLAGSERRSNLAQTGFASRMMQRQTLSGYNTAVEGEDSDLRSRLTTFLSTYCDQGDNANGLIKLCTTAVPKTERRNIDVDYTRNIESRLTLDVDFLPAEGSTAPAAVKEDEQDVFALAANLYSHNVAPKQSPELLGSSDDEVRLKVAEKYMDLRAVFAKRSVAQNSFAAITAMRASGAPESAPYTKALIKELGVSDQTEIEKLIGKNPSYFAQMELLTKKIYQNPTFYTELYDKPANVDRKGAALQAIGLMQDRDLYNSLLRSEAVLSVLLETMLEDEQEIVVNNMRASTGSQGSMAP